jgi:heparosan-N-sulfate-glucuronate 5-epimerase
LTRTIPKVWRLVTGIVPDVGPQTDGLVEPTQGMLGRYSLDFRPALRTRHYEPFDEEGIPVRTWSAVAGYAIACFQRLGDTGDPLWERRFLAQARYLVSRAEPSPAGGMGWTGGPPRAAFKESSLKAGWMSALYQGQAMSVLVRAHLLTKEPAFLDAANEAWPMLLVPVARGGLAATFASTTDDCWEELPTTPPSRILNGWIHAIWGLLDLAAVTPSTRVQDVPTSALESLRRHLPEYDTGWWSTYDHPDGKPPRLASVNYHYAHIWMLRALAARTGIGDFALWATRWDRDAHTATHRLRALVGKAGQRLAHGY